MIYASLANRLDFFSKTTDYVFWLRYLLFGVLLALSFAPFHLPGFAILSLAFLHHTLLNNKNQPFLCGLFFGLGFFGVGISWVYISIHDYGHLHSVIAAGITLLFLIYLSLFPALVATIFCYLAIKSKPIASGLLFSALWTGSDYLRSILFSGFPWLLTGFGQVDTPAIHLLPIIGVFGTGFVTCFAATLLSNGIKRATHKQYAYLLLFVTILLSPLLLKPISWTKTTTPSISTGIIQANLSMRDKWDDHLFWQLLQRYHDDVTQLLGTKLIVLPESAIPLPAVYLDDFLNNWHQQAKQHGSAILSGIPQSETVDEQHYYNAMISLGKATGVYFKQHLVPFGEYIPALFQFSTRFGVPDANLKPGKNNQSLINVHHHPIASLICYELGYGDLLRRQLPKAEWIVSISDAGWFGHSLAMYQQQQMAQVLSVESGRYQVMANNDGLSSIIDTHGHITASLPAFDTGILTSVIYPATGQTPWTLFGDWPALFFSLLIVLIFITLRSHIRKEHH